MQVTEIVITAVISVFSGSGIGYYFIKRKATKIDNEESSLVTFYKTEVDALTKKVEELNADMQKLLSEIHETRTELHNGRTLMRVTLEYIKTQQGDSKDAYLDALLHELCNLEKQELNVQKKRHEIQP